MGIKTLLSSGSFCLTGCYMPAVKDIMTKEVVTIDVNKSIFEVSQLMASKGLGCLIVVDKGLPVGIITERDIVRRIVAKRSSADLKVADVMTKTLVTVGPETSLKEAARVMSTNKIRRLPVLKQNQLVGIVVASDFVRNVGKKTTTEEILDALGRYPTGPVS
jgi:CBS domain-containing protein